MEGAQGDPSAALISYQASFAIRDRLTKYDASNAGWRAPSWSPYNKIGNMQLKLGDLPAALSSYQAMLNIADRLAKSDSSNAAGSATCRSRTRKSASCSSI